MVVKDGVDHGPFSAKQLIARINEGSIQQEHLLTNTESGASGKIKSFPDFEPFLSEYQLVQQRREESAALEASRGRERRSTMTKVVVLGLIALFTVGSLGLFWFSRRGNEKASLERARRSELFELGEIEIKSRKRRGRGSKRRRGSKSSSSSGTGGGSVSSYDEAMNQAVELDLGKQGGESQLTRSQVQSVMNRHLQSLSTCAGSSRPGKVDLDLAISGDGSVLGVTVRAGSPEFKACVRKRAKRIRFPEFDAPRMGAGYSFSVD